MNEAKPSCGWNESAPHREPEGKASGSLERHGSACYWEYHNGHGGEWETQCGAWYDADDFGCSEISKCPKCGREATTAKPNVKVSDPAR